MKCGTEAKMEEAAERLVHLPLLSAHLVAKGGLEFRGVEAEGSGKALVGDIAVAIDEEQAVRPAGVIFLDGVIEAIDQGGDFDAELAHTRGGEAGALSLHRRRAFEEDAVTDVGGRLPQVSGMRFLDIDDEEGGIGAVFLVEAIELGNLPAEWRSSIAAEDEDDGALATECAQLNGLVTLPQGQGEVRGGIADIEVAGARLHPEGTVGTFTGTRCMTRPNRSGASSPPAKNSA